MGLQFAKWVFRIAGIWGLFVLSLGYGAYLLGLEGATIDTDRHELVHGFFLIAMAWQVAFLIIASDPARFRLLMLAAMLEKFPFTLVVLLLQASVPAPVFALGMIDGLLGILFGIAYLWTNPGADSG